ncbi:hypothetical protein K6119_11275 [Paracrocinitomix mangrovi]|uniref:hypothetical protein n=1 Tax=Paracrocinitomix mangrovi TaxID=2862509 RepID=UPI001C8D825C|nr:hypothetical protein [Paracrocinitomix mangrovi]UKN00315.1 hypothetical protein K6119_11275 [Paracrocinitomix mangrovi]
MKYRNKMIKGIIYPLIRLLSFLIIFGVYTSHSQSEQQETIDKRKLATSMGVPIFYTGIDQIELEVHQLKGEYKKFNLSIKKHLGDGNYKTLSRFNFNGKVPESYVVNDSLQIIEVKDRNGYSYLRCSYDSLGRLTSKRYYKKTGELNQIRKYEYNETQRACFITERNVSKNEFVERDTIHYDEFGRTESRVLLKYEKYKQVHSYSYNTNNLIDTIFVDNIGGDKNGYAFKYELNNSMDWVKMSIYDFTSEGEYPDYIITRILE